MNDLFTDIPMALSIGFVVRQIVVYLKPAWSKVDEKLRPLVNTLCAFFFGILVTFAVLTYHQEGKGISYTLSLGFLAGIVAILYNDSRANIDSPSDEGEGVMKIVKKLSKSPKNKDQ